MPVELDLADIQGNILTAYGRLGFPKGRFILLHVDDGDAGRALVRAVGKRVTTALRWPSARKGIPTGKVEVERPLVAVNIAFTFYGLLALGVPIRTLRGMPDEFIDGMAGRTRVLGDDFPADAIGRWDPVWRNEADPNRRVHILITLNAQMTDDGQPVPELENTTQWIRDLCARSGGGVRILSGHKGPNGEHQDLSAILERGPDGAPQPVPKEHFGFFDGIGDPVFEGQLPDDAECLRVVGNGKIGTDGIWQPLATGEFLLGYPDEAQEIAGFGMPISFSRNGTFMAYRKLHQNVAAFRDYVARTSLRFGQVFGINDPDDAREAFLAKMSGRWSDGVPVVRAPTIEAWRAFNERFPLPKPGDQAAENRRTQALSDYVFRDDPIGAKCPLTAHVRRANPRDMLDPLGNSEDPKLRNGSVLNNRRRILRRGLPYGSAAPDETDDGGEHGIVMLNVCASLFRQFEFVQQQWMNYGLDFNAGSDTCPLVGNHDKGAKFVIPADPQSGHPPFIAGDLPQFVETRGGAYFFVPSITALGTICMGVVDPT